MRFGTALGASIVLHGVVAAGIVAYMKYASAPTALAQLDLSSVELSFAEEEDESAAATTALPPPSPPKPPSPRKERPPEARMSEHDMPLPPQSEAAMPPKCEPAVEKMTTPAAPPQESASKSAPRQAKIDAPPKPRKTIRPDYPRRARQRGEQGNVVVEIRVDENGAVESASVVSSCGFADLDKSALRAVKAALFDPAKSEGKAVASTARLTLVFHLR